MEILLGIAVVAAIVWFVAASPCEAFRCSDVRTASPPGDRRACRRRLAEGWRR